MENFAQADRPFKTLAVERDTPAKNPIIPKGSSDCGRNRVMKAKARVCQPIEKICRILRETSGELN